MKIKMNLTFCPGELPKGNPHFEEYYDQKEVQFEVPGVYEVCGRCHGEGKHPNPAIDSNGISMEEFAEDPDFAEAYFSGCYDVICENCHGKRVEPRPDYNAIDRDPTLKPIFDNHENGERCLEEMYAEMEAEKRFGA
jgi:hypothetical protein